MNTKDSKDDFFIKLSEESRCQLIQKSFLLSKGITKKKVEKIMGKPYSKSEMSPKDTDEIKAFIWDYYLSRKDKDLVNSKYDETILVVFSPEGYLTEVSRSYKRGLCKQDHL